MSVSFQHIPDNLRVPLFYAELDNSQASFFQIQQRALLIGQKLDEAEAEANAPALVTSVAEVKDLAGRGSILAHMMETYRQNDGFGEVWILPVADDSAGVKATGSVQITSGPTAAGTLNLYIAGQRVRIGVEEDDSAEDVASALAEEINDEDDLPVTASAEIDTVTITAKNAGTLGNDIDLRLNYRGRLGGETTPQGMSVEITAMSDGSGDPELGDALANLGDKEYDFVASPYTDSANLDLIDETWSDQTGRWAWDKQIYGHVWSAKQGTVSELSTFGNSRNGPHVTVMGYDGSPTPPWRWAAAMAGQAAKSIRNDPARPLQTLPLVGLLPPASDDQFEISERNILLFDGVATHYVDDGGMVRIERSITTYRVNAFGQPDPSYLDVTTMATLTAVLRRLRAVITQKFPRHKLANDGTRFGPGQAIVTPNVIRAELIAQYSEMEFLGLVENIDAFKDNLIVQRNADDPNRVDVVYPPDLVNQLRVFAVLAQFRLRYPPEIE